MLNAKGRRCDVCARSPLLFFISILFVEIRVTKTVPQAGVLQREHGSGVAVLDGNARLLAIQCESVTFTLDSQQTSAAVKDGTARTVFTLEHARLWDGLDDPYLYTVTARLDNGETETARFGCRKFEIDPQKGFILNGRPYPLRGVSRHHITC